MGYKSRMLYPTSTSDGSMCKEKGHSMADRRGNCISCGQPVKPGGWDATPAPAKKPRRSRKTAAA